MATKSNLLKKVPKRKRRISPITVDEQYTGPEPEFAEGEEIDKIQIGAGLNYYTYHKNVKDAKKYIVEYLVDYDRTDEAKQVKACPDVFIISTYGWLARMSTRGAKFNVEMDVIERLDKHIEYICKQIEILTQNLYFRNQNGIPVVRDRPAVKRNFEKFHETLLLRKTSKIFFRFFVDCHVQILTKFRRKFQNLTFFF